MATSLLKLAIQLNSITLTWLALYLGADPNALIKGKPLLEMVILQNKKQRIIDLLLEKGAVSITEESPPLNDTPLEEVIVTNPTCDDLLEAVEDWDVKKVKAIIDAGVDIYCIPKKTFLPRSPSFMLRLRTQ